MKNVLSLPVALGILGRVQEEFKEKLEKEFPECFQTTVLVGYSGGADSTCLLHILKNCGVDVVAAHLNHGQREEGKIEEQKCADFCDALEIPFISGLADVPRIAEEQKIGLEEAGRRARYAFFRQAAGETNCSLIATAHTSDDQAETVLMNLIRGAGSQGLTGIPLVNEGVIRPLLNFSRNQTIEYCEKNSFWYHNDPANSDLVFTRARLRHKIIPELEKINPSTKQAICRTSEILRSENELLDSLAARTLEQAEKPLNGNLRFLTLDCEALFDRQTLLHSPLPLLRRSIRLAGSFLGGQYEFNLIDKIVESLMTGDTVSYTSSEGQVITELTSLDIHFRKSQVDSPFKFPLTLPGETVSEIFGWKLIAQSWSCDDYIRNPESLDIVLDKEKVSGSLFFRSREEGDEMNPLGMSGHKKVGDLLQEQKLTQAAKARLPIICDEQGVIWVPSCSMSDRVKVTEMTQTCIRLTLEPLTS